MWGLPDASAIEFGSAAFCRRFGCDLRSEEPSEAVVMQKGRAELARYALSTKGISELALTVEDLGSATCLAFGSVHNWAESGGWCGRSG